MNISTYSQNNMIPNCSFEDTLACPTWNTGGVIQSKHWFTPNMSTPEIFHTCSKKNTPLSVNVPHNRMGNQNPLIGSAYAGIWISYTNDVFLQEYEYLSVNLLQKLAKDSLYYIKMNIVAAENSSYFLDRIGIFISNQKLLNLPINKLIDTIPQIESDSIYILNNTDNWLEIAGYYKANGNEESINIGCFRKFKDLSWESNTPINYISEGAYYYIDSVTVILYRKPDTIIPPKTPQYTLFPNPATDEIKIEFKNVEPNSVEIELYDIIGRRILIKQSNIIGSKYQADIRFLASGVYAYRLKVDGEFMGDGKLIVLR